MTEIQDVTEKIGGKTVENMQLPSPGRLAAVGEGLWCLPAPAEPSWKVFKCGASRWRESRGLASIGTQERCSQMIQLIARLFATRFWPGMESWRWFGGSPCPSWHHPGSPNEWHPPGAEPWRLPAPRLGCDWRPGSNAAPTPLESPASWQPASALGPTESYRVLPRPTRQFREQSL